MVFKFLKLPQLDLGTTLVAPFSMISGNIPLCKKNCHLMQNLLVNGPTSDF
jgi:hypothetical protein